jgi:formylglycine-generating enzyme
MPGNSGKMKVMRLACVLVLMIYSLGAAPPSTQPGGMVLIHGGAFMMGTGEGFAYEGPPHKVGVHSFYMDKTPVTVGEFARFVAATHYQTDAERLGWSGVFDIKKSSWTKGDKADWRHPEGAGKTAPENEPVTQVSFADAQAYAKWQGKRLPSEAEFEYAARGGLEGKTYAWGDELHPGGKYLANFWQGSFPEKNTSADGFTSRSPVGSFPPNGYGLYDITGNVWEWTSDWFSAEYYSRSPIDNPKGPDNGEEKVIRGGSWMCCSNFCSGYRVASRQHTPVDSGLNNLGFRCVKDSE